jgi:hypothetical protein
MKILLVHTPFNWRRPLTLVAYLIRKVTGTYYNHACFLHEVDGHQLILESDIKGVVKTHLVDWAKQQIVAVYVIKDMPEAAVKRAYSFVGQFSYSFMDLLWFMPLYLLTNKFYGRTVDEAKNKPTCYEYLARVLDMQNWHRMTPNEFSAECKKRGYQLQIEKLPVSYLIN